MKEKKLLKIQPLPKVLRVQAHKSNYVTYIVSLSEDSPSVSFWPLLKKFTREQNFVPVCGELRKLRQERLLYGDTHEHQAQHHCFRFFYAFRVLEVLIFMCAWSTSLNTVCMMIRRLFWLHDTAKMLEGSKRRHLSMNHHKVDRACESLRRSIFWAQSLELFSSFSISSEIGVSNFIIHASKLHHASFRADGGFLLLGWVRSRELPTKNL